MTDPSSPSTIHAEAIAWVVRTGDPAFEDWAGFEAWLAASPDHVDAYHEVSAAEAEMVAILRSAPAQEALRLVRPVRWRAWGGGAAAAALVVLLGVHQFAQPTGPDRIFETRPGVSRVVALDDGTRVTLNGDTRLAVAADEPRSVRLERGEGLFTVRHRADAPFRVQVGGATLVDIGTVFNVVRDASMTRVAVAEGAVEWRADGDAVRIDAGHSLTVEDGESAVALADVASANVGDWSRGELVFDGQPLGSAAASLSRTLGVAIRVTPALASRPVRATIRLSGDRDTVVRQFGTLLGLQARREGQAWRLSATP